VRVGATSAQAHRVRRRHRDLPVRFFVFVEFVIMAFPPECLTDACTYAYADSGNCCRAKQDDHSVGHGILMYSAAEDAVQQFQLS